ncbi:YlxR family protein [Microbacterium aurantiacum]|uniref:YlxR family protein n=1 Tax=Microbacterium aurantiacum TaxID=162393 RepID=UPI003D74D799
MEPVRMCVACRARVPRTTLLRVVARESVLVIDERAVLPGRGAWVHASSACMGVAVKRRAFVRALRVSGPLDTQTIEEHLQQDKG